MVNHIERRTLIACIILCIVEKILYVVEYSVVLFRVPNITFNIYIVLSKFSYHFIYAEIKISEK